MNWKLTLAASALAMAVSTAAGAQTDAAQNDTVPQAADAASGQSTQIEDIVVTAQRRSENLQKVPISVSAVTAETALALGVRSTAGLTSLAPSLTFQNQIGNASPYLRGVGTSAVSAGQENSVAVYVDGVYIASQSAALFSLNNIERIEVLKGPQSTLFGRNATGGLIQIITRDPSHDTQVEGSIGYGNYDTTEAKLYATTGLTDWLAVDIAASYSHQGKGWGKNIATGEDVNRTTRDLALRSKWLFTPTDSTRITLAGDYSELRGSVGVSARPFEGAVALGGYVFPGRFHDTSGDIQPSIRSKVWGASLKIEQDLDFARLVSISAYRRSRASQNVDFDGTPTPGIGISLNPYERQFTQELQILSPDSSPVKWIAGVFYFRANSQYDPFDLQLFPAITHAPGEIINRTTSRQITRSLSAFAQATVPLGDDTRITAGVRYTEDKRRADWTSQTLLTFAPASPPAVISPTQSTKEGKPTWRLSIDHDFSEGILGYASYNRGFKSGLYNLQVPDSAPLKAEKIDAYEVGAKIDALDRHLRMNAAVFYYDYQNIQLQRVDSGVVELVNAASAKIYGVDFEITAVPFDGLTLRGGLGLLHSRYGNFPGAVLNTPARDPLTGALIGGNTVSSFNAKGRRTVYAPDYTMNFSATYEKRFEAGKLGITAGYYRSGRRYFEADNRLFQPEYDLISAEVSWALPSDNLRFRVWGRNLGNTKVYNQLTEQAVIDGAIADAPRTYGAAIDFKF